MRGYVLVLLVLACVMVVADKHDPSPCVKNDDGVWCPGLDGDWHHKDCHGKHGKHHGGEHKHGKHHKDGGEHKHGKHHKDGEQKEGEHKHGKHHKDGEQKEVEHKHGKHHKDGEQKEGEHKHGKHHKVGQLTKPELKPDDQGCYTKSDGVWCPTEYGMWIRDDGVEWSPHHGGHHKWQRMCRLKMLGWALGALVLLIGLVWGYFERKRRRGLEELPGRSGGYMSGLFECMRSPRICLPACFFTPVLAAFNRAKVDQRECGVCDVCFALIKPVAQYTTRQTIRGKYQLADDSCSDALQACCCTPCAVGQDTLELEKRATAQSAPLPAPLTAPGMPPVYVTVDAQPAEVCMDKMEKADNQV